MTRPLPRVVYIPRADSPDALHRRVRRLLASSQGLAASVAGRPALAGAAVLVRAYGMDPGAVWAALSPLRGSLRDLELELWYAGRADLARALDAEGLHLPERGMETADARRVFEGRVGRACHDEAGLARAADADYAILSPVHAVDGKNPPLGFPRAAALVAHQDVPVLLLGGLSAADGEAIAASGAYGLAVMRAVDDAAEPGATLAQLLRGTAGHLAQ